MQEAESLFVAYNNIDVVGRRLQNPTVGKLIDERNHLLPYMPSFIQGKLKTILTAYHDDMILSLSIGGIDLRTANWNAEIINRNAYKSAGIIIEAASRHMECCDAFLQTIIRGCRRQSTMMDTMEMICAVFEHINALPPLGIIQHTLHPELLKIYCANLATWLKKYLQNSPDCVFLRPGFMVESLK